MFFHSWLIHWHHLWISQARATTHGKTFHYSVNWFHSGNAFNVEKSNILLFTFSNSSALFSNKIKGKSQEISNSDLEWKVATGTHTIIHRSQSLEKNQAKLHLPDVKREWELQSAQQQQQSVLMMFSRQLLQLLLLLW